MELKKVMVVNGVCMENNMKIERKHQRVVKFSVMESENKRYLGEEEEERERRTRNGKEKDDFAYSRRK